MVQTRIGEFPPGKTASLRIDMEPSRAGYKATLIASGQIKPNDYGTVNTLLFVELGSGIYLNLVDNPKAEESGMGIDILPGQIYALNLGG